MDGRWTWKLEQAFFLKVVENIQELCRLRDHAGLSFQLRRIAGVRRDARRLLMLAENVWGNHAVNSGVRSGRVAWVERLLYLRGAAVKLYRDELTLGDWLEQAREKEG